MENEVDNQVENKTENVVDNQVETKIETPVKPKSSGKKALIIILIIAGGIFVLLVLLVVLVLVFGKPDAKDVFKDMNKTMLETKTLTVSSNYQGTDDTGDTIDYKSTNMLDLTNSKELKASGNFEMDVKSSTMPAKAKAEYIVIGGNRYIKISEFSSSDSTVDSVLNQAESKLKGKWIKVRANDSYSTLADTPIDLVMTVFPTPFANLTGTSQLNDIIKIMDEKSTYTIEESSKVELGSISAYKYSLNYDKDQYNKFAKIITDYASYFKSSSDSNGEKIDKYNVWVDTNSKHIAKIELAGKDKKANILVTMQFGDYNKVLNIQKPDDYNIESELLN